jgi:DNA-binding transcriptional MerR regulator
MFPRSLDSASTASFTRSSDYGMTPLRESQPELTGESPGPARIACAQPGTLFVSPTPKIPLDPRTGSRVDTRPRKVTTGNMRSGELARECGISADTLRHYERIGVLQRPKRTAAGYRQYPPEAVKRVRLVRGALEIGFTLQELAGILKVRDSGGAPCREVRALAETKLEQVICKIDDLCDLRDHMRNVLADWDKRLGETPRGVRAGLLEALMSLPSRKGHIQ